MTVIIPVFNGQAYLPEALRSVVAQGIDNIEIIVVDDGSTDGTRNAAEALGDPRLRYVWQRRMGAAAARNYGVALAISPFLAFLDADDVWLSGKLKAQIASLENSNANMSFTYMEEFISPDCAKELKGLVKARPRLAGLCPSTLLVRRSDFQRVGGFDPGNSVGEFIDWYARAIDLGLRPALSPGVFVRRRVHNANTTRLHRDEAARYAVTMKKILDRRRAVL